MQHVIADACQQSGVRCVRAKPFIQLAVSQFRLAQDAILIQIEAIKPCFHFRIAGHATKESGEFAIFNRAVDVQIYFCHLLRDFSGHCPHRDVLLLQLAENAVLVFIQQSEAGF